jgi:hypothetical protein
MHLGLNSAADHITHKHEILLYVGSIKTQVTTFGIAYINHNSILIKYYSMQPHNKNNNTNLIFGIFAIILG